jgi:hypothetical protein
MKTLLFSLLTLALLATAPASAEDKSYSVKTYIEKGLPSPDREWSAKDYQTAVEVLKKIAAEEKQALPRKGSPTSGPCFDRLVNAENLSLIKNPKLPIGARLLETGQLMKQMSPLVLLYVTTDNKEYGPEILAMTLHSLVLADQAFIIADAFFAELPEKERNAPARQAGLKKMRSGMATSLTGVLTMLEEDEYYHGKPLERFSTDLVTVFPPVCRRLEPTVQKELKLRVQKLMKSHKNEKVRASLEKLDKALEK